MSFKNSNSHVFKTSKSTHNFVAIIAQNETTFFLSLKSQMYTKKGKNHEAIK